MPIQFMSILILDRRSFVELVQEERNIPSREINTFIQWLHSFAENIIVFKTKFKLRVGVGLCSLVLLSS